jgi:hypothetical protein
MFGWQFNIIAAENLATGAASAQSGAAPALTTHARLVQLTNNARFLPGANPTALASSPAIATGGVAFIRITAGNKIAAIQDTAAGTLSISWLSSSPAT